MNIDKKTADRMARGSKKGDNVVFGQLKNKTEFYEFGKFRVDFSRDGITEVGLSLQETIQLAFDEIARLTDENKKLHKSLKLLAKDLKKYKGKVGIK